MKIILLCIVVYTTSYNFMCTLCIAEVSNLLVVTKDRAPTPQTPMQESQLSFHRILKEEIEQVHLFIFTSVSHVRVCAGS